MTTRIAQYSVQEIQKKGCFVFLGLIYTLMREKRHCLAQLMIGIFVQVVMFWMMERLRWINAGFQLMQENSKGSTCIFTAGLEDLFTVKKENDLFFISFNLGTIWHFIYVFFCYAYSA